MKQRLAVVGALVVMLAISTTSVLASTTQSYYDGTIAPTGASNWLSLSGAAPGGISSTSYNANDYTGNVSRTVGCFGSQTCFGDTSVPNVDSGGSLGMTGGAGYTSYVNVPVTVGSGSGSPPFALQFWFKPSSDTGAWSGVVGTTNLGVQSWDHFQHLWITNGGDACIHGGNNSCSGPRPESGDSVSVAHEMPCDGGTCIGKWTQVTLVAKGDGNLNIWINGTLRHTWAASLRTGQSEFSAGNAITLGSTFLPAGGSQYQSDDHSYRGSYYGVGVWTNTAVPALEKGTNGCIPTDPHVLGGACMSLITTTWALGSGAPEPPNVVCTPNPDGTHTCTAAGAGQCAPISHSCLKFQLGYETVNNCTLPSDWTQISLYISWLSCDVGRVLQTVMNGLLFAANCFIDLLLPDGSGLQSWIDNWTSDYSHRAPMGYLTNAIAEVTSTFGGMCSQSSGSVSSCSGSGVNTGTLSVHWKQANGATQGGTFDLVSALGFMNQTLIFGITGRTILSAWIFLALTKNVISAVGSALEPQQQMLLPI